LNQLLIIAMNRGVEHNMKQVMHPMLRNTHGNAAIEFALVLPLMLLLFIGTVEYGRYVVAAQRTDKTAFNLANLITTARPEDPSLPTQPDSALDCAALRNDILGGFDNLMAPFPATGAGRGVRVVSVQRDPASNAIIENWREEVGNPGTSQALAQVAAIRGGGAGAMAPGENIIAVEVYHRYDTITTSNILGVLNPLTGNTIVRRAFLTPRRGNLTDYPCA
jgi:Flp pilus assembly pilin Flp